MHSRTQQQEIDEEEVLGLLDTAFTEAKIDSSVSPPPPTAADADGTDSPPLTMSLLLRALSSPDVVAVWRAEVARRLADQHR